MDKKTIILLALLVILLIFYFPLMEKLGLYSPGEPSQPDRTEQTQPAETPPDTSIPEQVRRQRAQDSLEVAGDLAESESVDTTQMAPAPIDTIYVETNEYLIMLSSLGGGPISMRLKEYEYREGGPVQMIPGNAVATPNARFAGGTFRASQQVFTSNRASGSYDAMRDTFDIVYTYTGPSGGSIEKHYRFYPDAYHYDLFFSIRDHRQLGFERSYQFVWNTPLGVTEPQPQTDYEAMEGVAMMAGSRETLDDFDDGVLNQSLDGTVSWAGVRSKYFAAVLIPKNRTAESVYARGTKKKIARPEGQVEQRKITVGIEMPFASDITDTFQVFVGPLDYTLMDDYDVGLEDMLGIGTTPFVGWIIKPFAIAIMWLLPKMYDVVPNYGLVIIIFALLVKLITLPLSMKSFKSMNAMKELQPKLEELKKKHKNNPQALNQEMMKLYKKHGVNPMSGCLPMLPQMPLFFALFSVFRSTILLRNAPFVWFIDDLSRGADSFTDPYIILVVIMVAAQFISQKLTMASSQQNKMFMYIMPLFMGFIFYRFAAGLVLYWACFSIFSLIDYFAFKRKARKNPEIETA